MKKALLLARRQRGSMRLLLVFVLGGLMFICGSALVGLHVQLRHDREMADRQDNQDDIERDVPATSAKSAKEWIQIANDPTNEKIARREAVFQVFRYYVPPGMKLSALAHVLEHPKWLVDKNVMIFGALKGKIPVKITDEDTVFCIVVFPELPGAIYLRVAGKVERNAFVKVLREGKADQKTDEAKILEVAVDLPPFPRKMN